MLLVLFKNICVKEGEVSFRLDKSLSLSFRGGLQQTSWTRVFLEPTDHFDVESATYKEHRVSQLSSLIWREQLLDANLDQGLGAVFATLKIPTLFLSETLRPCLEQDCMELYVLLRTEGQKNVTCLAATLVHIVQGQIRKYPPPSTPALTCSHGPTLQ